MDGEKWKSSSAMLVRQDDSRNVLPEYLGGFFHCKAEQYERSVGRFKCHNPSLNTMNPEH